MSTTPNLTTCGERFGTHPLPCATVKRYSFSQPVTVTTRARFGALSYNIRSAWYTGLTSHSSFRPHLPKERSLGVASSATKRKSHGTTQKFTPGGEEVPIETPREMTFEDIDAMVQQFKKGM